MPDEKAMSDERATSSAATSTYNIRFTTCFLGGKIIWCPVESPINIRAAYDITHNLTSFRPRFAIDGLDFLNIYCYIFLPFFQQIT